MKNKITDERIELSKTSTKAQAFDVVLMYLIYSLLSNIFINKVSLMQIIDKISILFLMVAFVLIVNFYKRNYISFSELSLKKITVISTLLSTIVLTITMSFENYLKYSDKYSGIFDFGFMGVVIIFFIQILVYFGIIYYLLYKKEGR